MRITGIGINALPDHINGEVRKLKDDLQHFQQAGYDYVEIPVDAMDIVYCGRLNPYRMVDLKAVLREFNLKYTVHAPWVLDLRDIERKEIQKELFKTCILFTSEIGAEIFVYHYGRRTEDEEVEESLYHSMLEVADFAADYGVQICVENIEIDLVSNVVEFVEKVGKENVGMTFDLGHAYLAAKRFGFDFLDSIKMARPYIKHIHVSDNFGRYDEMRLLDYDRYRLTPYPNRLLLGLGDLHLPPGWGEVPLDEAFDILDNYEGIFMLEYYFYRYEPHSREILEAARSYVKRHTS